jgi:hypothetical protein
MNNNFKAWDKVNKKIEDIDGCHLYLADGKVYEVYEQGGWSSYMEKRNMEDRYIPLQGLDICDITGQLLFEGYTVRCIQTGHVGKIAFRKYYWTVKGYKNSNFDIPFMAFSEDETFEIVSTDIDYDIEGGKHNVSE